MKLNSQKGSILLSSTAFVFLLFTAASGILALTMNSYKLTMRNELRVQARIVAESELENIYFKAFGQVLVDQPAANIPTLLGPYADVSVTADILPSTAQAGPFLPQHAADGWRIKRSISYVPAYDSFTGMIPGTTKHGNVTYVTVRVEVQPKVSSPFAQAVTVKVGRRFEVQKSSIFQYSVFFQGDLELQPSGIIEIKGDIAANGSIYAGANGATSSLQFDGKIRYLKTGYFDQDSTGATVMRRPNTYNISATPIMPPAFLTGQGAQLETLSAPENLLGGVDAVELQTRRPDLFHDVNDVYRSAIVPPPGHTEEYPSVADDPTIAAQRMYTRAGLRVEVDNLNQVHVYKPDGSDVTGNFSSIVVGGTVAGGNVPLFDQREGTNIGVTTIDMGALKTALETYYPTGTNDFNGSIYFNLRSSSSSTPKAIRLTNATKVFARGGKGLTVATNGGVYVQGDYNTITDYGTGVDHVNYTGPDAAHKNASIVPSMIMGDQVTVLSSGWLDANATQTDKVTYRSATADVTIQAGILTGNTPPSTTVASGGAQNLVRFEEFWAAHRVEFFGSLGRLFDSKTFTHAWDQPGVGNVYGSPLSRTYIFDSNLRDSPPSGSPYTTSFLRGTFFTYN